MNGFYISRDRIDCHTSCNCNSIIVSFSWLCTSYTVCVCRLWTSSWHIGIACVNFHSARTKHHFYYEPKQTETNIISEFFVRCNRAIWWSAMMSIAGIKMKHCNAKYHCLDNIDEQLIKKLKLDQPKNPRNDLFSSSISQEMLQTRLDQVMGFKTSQTGRQACGMANTAALHPA